jgi:Raf kinase inhibitor-like YbhB/YbcL family protein
MNRRMLGPLAWGLTMVVLATACNDDGRELAEPTTRGTQSIVPSTTLDPATVPATDFVDDTLPGEDLTGDTGGLVQVDDDFSVGLPFNGGEPIDSKYTCNGENMSPSVDWFDAPQGTVEIAVELVDLDSPDYVHWVVAGLDPAIGQLEDGDVPEGAIQATNSEGEVGYTGPCPPPGQTHTYEVRLHALNTPIAVANGASAADLRAAITAAIIETASETGTYTG